MPKATFLLKKPVGWRSGGAPYGRGTISGRNLVDSVPKFRQGWTAKVDCVAAVDAFTVRFSTAVDWEANGFAGITFTNNRAAGGSETISPSAAATPGNTDIQYSTAWIGADPVQGDVITMDYTDVTGTYFKAGSTSTDDPMASFSNALLINCADPQSNVQIIGAWTGKKDCGVVTTDNLIDGPDNLIDGADNLVDAGA